MKKAGPIKAASMCLRRYSLRHCFLLVERVVVPILTCAGQALYVKPVPIFESFYSGLLKIMLDIPCRTNPRFLYLEGGLFRICTISDQLKQSFWWKMTRCSPTRKLYKMIRHVRLNKLGNWYTHVASLFTKYKLGSIDDFLMRRYPFQSGRLL